jgi:hypothetical protein
MKNTILTVPFILFSTILAMPNIQSSFAADLTTSSLIATLNETSTYFISTNSLRVRSRPDATGKIIGQLSLNDKVKIINPSILYDKNLVEISIVRTYDEIEKSDRYFVNAGYISPVKVEYKEFTGKYFTVVNVATETIRLYERICADNSCPHKMLMESEVVVGEDVDHPKEEKGKGRSILGSYRVTGWTKFYEDSSGHYPAWYKDEYPAVPNPDANWNDWFSSRFMPHDKWGMGSGKTRGAFGWYTAFVTPEAYGQWTHGTMGWGSDKEKYIKKVKTVWVNVFADPRSSGCTRNNNEAIAYLRKMIDVGTPIIKIYAKEELLDPTLKDYPNEFENWNYVLTKNANHAVDREAVLKSLSISDRDLDTFWVAKMGKGAMILNPSNPLNDVLEVGTYQIDSHPDVIAYTPGEDMNRFTRKLGRKGNVYGIDSNEMHGVYYVDAGILEDYAHPDRVLDSAGFPDEMTPPWMKKSNLK